MLIAWHLLTAFWTDQARCAATGKSNISPTVLLAILQRRFPAIWGKNGGKLTQEHFEQRNEIDVEDRRRARTEQLRNMTREELEERIETLQRRRQIEKEP